MSFEQFYAIASQTDCINTCQNSDCQGYRWDSTGNCYLFFSVDSTSQATILNNRQPKIPTSDNYQASQSTCITSSCNAVKSNDLYDFNKCLATCTNDADCKGFGANNQQYCTYIKDSGQSTQFTGYTFNKTPSNSINWPLIIGIVVAVVVVAAFILLLMVIKIRKPIKRNEEMDYFNPNPYRQSVASSDGLHRPFSSDFDAPVAPIAPNTPQYQPNLHRQNVKTEQLPLNTPLNQHELKLTNANYNDLWGSKSLERGASIPGINTSTHIDYHLSKDDQ
eukprot:NODE_375_length_8520_cov_0.377390.p4 type:complete len:278 gc:universal NODE_375_length_8520_cov_0.377390:2516-3349(+)